MKVKITAAVPTKSKNGKFYQQIQYDNDQKASAWDDDLTPFVNQEVDVEITEKNGYKNVKLVGGAAKPAAPAAAPTTRETTSDYAIRYNAILLAIELLKSKAVTITDPNVLSEASKIEGWLRHGFPQENKG